MIVDTLSKTEVESVSVATSQPATSQSATSQSATFQSDSSAKTREESVAVEKNDGKKKLPTYAKQLEQFQIITKIAWQIMVTAVLITALGAVILCCFQKLFWGLGYLLGGAIVVGDCYLFYRFACRSRPGRLEKPLWVTVVKFYLVSVINIGLCFLVIKFGLGHPLGFLFGLLVFLPAVSLGLLKYLFHTRVNHLN
jgi:hypothetical protein